ncbi:MAG: tRNA1(Val) (adenine(37)-N6)-methyltransferase [Flavobacterium sp.]
MFKFKQFTIHQDRCAMKVGTDGVVLGAWIPLDNDPIRILDIGAGTGLLALMLAQRSEAMEIDAVEIDEDAFEQCVENFEASPWGDRLFCYHADIRELADDPEEPYDLIVSNPPFFSEDTLPDNPSRALARNNELLPFEVVLESVSVLLAEEGHFAVILPFKEEDRFIELAHQYHLFPKKMTRVKGTPSSDIKRSLMFFSKHPSECSFDELILEVDRHVYTEEFKKIVEDFYLDK